MRWVSSDMLKWTYITPEEDALSRYKSMKDHLMLFCADASGDFKINSLLVYHLEIPSAFKKCKVHKSTYLTALLIRSIKCLVLLWNNICLRWVHHSILCLWRPTHYYKYNINYNYNCNWYSQMTSYKSKIVIKCIALKQM